MAEEVSQLTLPLLAEDGKTVAVVRIAAPPKPKALAPLQVLSSFEAQKWQEHPNQLLEGQSYDYELTRPFPGARLREGVIQRNGFSDSSVERGRINPGQHTGTLSIVLENSSGSRVASNAVEVRSVKLTYRSDYRQMLEDISEALIDLLFDIRSPSSTWLDSRISSAPANAVQQFFLIKHLVLSREFRAALSQITANPHEATKLNNAEVSTSRGIKGGRALARELAQRQPRIALPVSHPLYSKLRTVPAWVITTRAERSIDTAENRFVKATLIQFERFVSEIERTLRRSGALEYSQVINDCLELQLRLEEHHRHPFFHGVGAASLSPPLGSPVLQRRGGYREILRAWLSFNLASTLSWEGSEDLYLAGKKDVATLYEYWVFFQLRQIVSSIFVLDGDSSERLLSSGRGLAALKLKVGQSQSLHGYWIGENRNLRVRFSYNRTFLRSSHPPGDEERSFPNGGSWTKAMRPDYTISLWPEEMPESEAETNDLIFHLHFDAKYRVEMILQLFGPPDEDSLEVQDSSGTAKRDDLLKMHAYKDAIRRSVSAYVLFPGSEVARWRELQEIVPGLGAFPLSPGASHQSEAISDFILQAARSLEEKLAQCSP